MRAHTLAALIGAGLACLGHGGQTQEASRPIHIGTYVWSEAAEAFGGFSGLELTSDGTGFTAINDRGFVISGSLIRDGMRIQGVRAGDLMMLRDTDGTALDRYEPTARGWRCVRTDESMCHSRECTESGRIVT